MATGTRFLVWHEAQTAIAVVAEGELITPSLPDPRPAAECYLTYRNPGENLYVR